MNKKKRGQRNLEKFFFAVVQLNIHDVLHGEIDELQ